MTNVNNSDGEWAEIDYDANSNVTSVTGSNGISIVSTFDELNRVKSVTNSALERKLSFTYTANSQRASRTIQNLTTGLNKTTSYDYDSLGRITDIHSWTGAEIDYTYNADSSRNTSTLLNGLTVDHSYDSLGRLTGMAYKDATENPIASFDYILDIAGNRTQMTDNEGVSNFQYDNLNRLTRASYVRKAHSAAVQDSKAPLYEAFRSIEVISEREWFRSCPLSRWQLSNSLLSMGLGERIQHEDE